MDSFYDPSSIAAQSKREQFVKEAEEYRLRRHIVALQKLTQGEKTTRPTKHAKCGFLTFSKPHPRPAR